MKMNSFRISAKRLFSALLLGGVLAAPVIADSTATMAAKASPMLALPATLASKTLAVAAPNVPLSITPKHPVPQSEVRRSANPSDPNLRFTNHSWWRSQVTAEAIRSR